MTPPELNYNIHNKELLAIMAAVQEWRHYLEGAKHQVVIYCDHKNLAYFTSTKELTQQQEEEPPPRPAILRQEADGTLTLDKQAAPALQLGLGTWAEKIKKAYQKDSMAEELGEIKNDPNITKGEGDIILFRGLVYVPTKPPKTRGSDTLKEARLPQRTAPVGPVPLGPLQIARDLLLETSRSKELHNKTRRKPLKELQIAGLLTTLIFIGQTLQLGKILSR
ncbi:hypothetical protein VTN00DRAFT_5763 [Thermoascus crustaceus]|uniref:uncharacterized protein n=1 Tax=Thermoascus crustaceus TaxID=5088 RepID=UPI003744A844